MNVESMFLCLALGICHTIADYMIVTPKMLSAKAKGTPIFPIINHAATHAFLMGLVLIGLSSNLHIAPLLMCYQLVTHTIIDILKGKCNVWFPSVASPANKIHWILFGIDQYLHFFVIATMVYFNQNMR